MIHRFFLASFLLCSVALLGCSSDEPVLLEYTEDEIKSMDEEMGIGADGTPVADTKFDELP